MRPLTLSAAMLLFFAIACGGDESPADGLHQHAAAGQGQQGRLTYDFTASAGEEETFEGTVTIWSLSGDRRIDLEIDLPGEPVSATVIRTDEARYVCSFKVPQRCAVGSDAADDIEREMIDIVERPLNLRDEAAASADAVEPTSSSSEEIGGQDADCYGFAAPAPDETATTSLCFSEAHTVAAAEVRAPSFTASLRITGESGPASELDFRPPLALVEIIEYPPPDLIGSLPEGKLVIDGPPDQSSIFVADGGEVLEIEPARLYSLSPDGGAIAAFRETDTLVTKTLDGEELMRMDAGTPPSWEPGGDRFATQLLGEVVIGDASDGELNRFPILVQSRLAGWRPATDDVLIGELDTESRVHVVAYDVESGERRELAVVPQVDQHGVEFSPDGRYVSYFSESSLLRHHLWVLDLETGETCSVTDSAAGILHPLPAVWSPEGRWVKYWASQDPIKRRGEIHVYDAANCNDLETTGAESMGAEWSPDGRWLAISDKDGVEVTLWTPDGSRDGSTVRSGRIEWSPDATTIASVRGTEVAFTNIENGDFERVQVGARIDSLEWSPDSRYVAVGHEDIAEAGFSGASQLFVVDARTGEVYQLWDAQLGYRPVAWVPD